DRKSTRLNSSHVSISYAVFCLKKKMAALIEHARLLVTVDSAPMHLASATGTPQVILFGPTNPFHWRPRKSPAAILFGESPEPLRHFQAREAERPMRQISTTAVIDAMRWMVSAPAASAV